MSAWSSSAEWWREVAAVDFPGREVLAVAVVGAVRAAFVVEAEEGLQAGRGLGQVGVAAQVDFVVFDRAPESLDENIVQAAALAVHGEFHASSQEWFGESRGRELAALVGVENFRGAVLRQRPLHGPDAKAGVEGVREFPRQHGPAVPIDHRAQIDEAADDGHIRTSKRGQVLGLSFKPNQAAN